MLNIFYIQADRRPGSEVVLNTDTARGGVLINTWHHRHHLAR